MFNNFYNAPCFLSMSTGTVLEYGVRWCSGELGACTSPVTMSHVNSHLHVVVLLRTAVEPLLEPVDDSLCLHLCSRSVRQLASVLLAAFELFFVSETVSQHL